LQLEHRQNHGMHAKDDEVSGIGAVGGIQEVMARIRRIEQAVGSPQVPFASVLESQTATGASPGSVGSKGVQSFSVRTGTDPGVQEALDWGKTQIGAPYASVNPYRFGTVGWDGGSHTSTIGSKATYQFPAGTRVYDCSGFATSLWRKAGVDLGKYDATSSASMLARIPQVPWAEARPGDLVITDSDGDGVAGHVAVIDGNGTVLDAQPNGGVQRRALSWEHVMAVVRPSLLNTEQRPA
jgi:cell wall-associated NlpC family hydrolase